MAMQLDNIVPFGRCLDEYVRTFALSAEDLGKRLIGVGDGPASFNAEMQASGRTMVSVDPLYAWDGAQIAARFEAVVDTILKQVIATPNDWVWAYHRTPAQLRLLRVAVLERFLGDYEDGKAAGRYVVGALPTLNDGDDRFDLALCSHLLFLYSDHLSYDFHRASVLEMLRVAPELRIFPILTLAREISPYVQPLVLELRAAGFVVTLARVDYELQRGGNQMLRIQRPA